jgi:hypothetical protein
MDIRTGEKVRRAMNFDRAEYGEIYHRTFGKGAGREACRQGWERWQEVQKVRASGLDVLTVHCSGTPVPAPHPNDYWAFAVLGPLRFLARINEAFLSDLPEKWLEFIRQEQVMKMLVTLGNNPRARARAFVQNSLVDGLVMDPVFGPAMASLAVFEHAGAD